MSSSRHKQGPRYILRIFAEPCDLRISTPSNPQLQKEAWGTMASSVSAWFLEQPHFELK
jgi:hypothetical protein